MTTTVFTALTLGAIYGLTAMLLSIPLVRCGVVNFAQMFYIVLGGYVVVDLLGRGWSTPLIAVALVVLGGLLGAGQEVLTMRPTHGAHESTLVTSVGFGIAIEGFIVVRWGTDPRSFEFFGGADPIRIWGGALRPVDLWIIGSAVVLALGLQLAVKRTLWGTVGRAVMEDPIAASLRGIDIPRLRTAAFAFAGSAACLAGLLVGARTGVSLDSTIRLVVFAFAAAAIGGFGNFAGSALGGFLIGFAEAFSARYLNVDWVPVLIFLLLVVVLLLRPNGLFGSRNLRVV